MMIDELYLGLDFLTDTFDECVSTIIIQCDQARRFNNHPHTIANLNQSFDKILSPIAVAFANH